MKRIRRGLSAVAVLSVGICSAGAAWGVAAAAPDAVKKAVGVVYEDVNENGVRDPGEPGIPGVVVSNGRDVVTTDRHGAYELAVDEETILFVTKPAKWDVPVNEVQLPQFYYLHYPNGTPVDLEYGGIAPTGPLPDSVDFALVKPERTPGNPNQFEAIVFADPQVRSLDEIEDLRIDVIEELKGTDARFGITVGDLVNDPLDMFGPYNEAVAELGIPWWNVPGNHDIDFDVPDDRYSTDTYKSVYGPTNYSFNYGKVHFIALDNIDYEGKWYRGYLSDEQLAWIEADLEHVGKDQLVVIVAHVPLRTDATDNRGINTENRDKLLGLLEGYAGWGFAGHDTSNSWQMYLDEQDGWFGKEPFHHQVMAETHGGGWAKGPIDERGVRAADMADGTPNGYYTVEFKGKKYVPTFNPASLPADFLMRHSFDGGLTDTVHVPGGPSGSGDFTEPVVFTEDDWTAAQPPRLTTNVFDGGEQHRVEFSIDGGKYQPMIQSEPALDPYAVELYERLQGTSDEPNRAEPSSHLWTVDLPAVGVGEHTVTVRSTDPWGQVTTRSASFQVS